MRTLRRRGLHGALAVCLLAPARPVHAVSKEMQVLQSDVDEIQRQVFEIKHLLEKQGADVQRLADLYDSPDARKQRADLNANLDALRAELRALSTKFEETTGRLGALERRVASLSAPAASSPTAAPEGTAPSPAGLTPDRGAEGAPASASAAPGGATEGAGDPGQSLFQQAYGDYIKDKLDLAVAEFREYVTRYPTSDLADNAQYWVGMSFFNQRKYDEALREFDLLLARYPKAENAPDALYRKGLSLLEMNRLGQAVLVFNQVVSDYPDTPAATQASQRLRELASGNR